MTRPLRLLVADILALMLDVGESKSVWWWMAVLHVIRSSVDSVLTLGICTIVAPSSQLYSNVNQMMNTLTAYGNVKVPANDVDCVA